jgi:hypothetical protein
MKPVLLAAMCLLIWSSTSFAATRIYDDQAAPPASPAAAKEQRAKDEQAKEAAKKELTAKVDEATTARQVDEARNGGRFVRTLTNVQIELTLTDQTGSGTPDKKTVSMIVSSGNWGRIRSSGNMFPPGETPLMVDLNVDARPFVSIEGPIPLELTVVDAPALAAGTPREPGKTQPVKINQSLTVVLQSGKPLNVSQAADPVTDRKVVVEVKATVLK